LSIFALIAVKESRSFRTADIVVGLVATPEFKEDTATVILLLRQINSADVEHAAEQAQARAAAVPRPKNGTTARRNGRTNATSAAMARARAGFSAVALLMDMVSPLGLTWPAAAA
jgi:hypothetical protein